MDPIATNSTNDSGNREWALKVYQAHMTTVLTLGFFWLTSTAGLLHVVQETNHSSFDGVTLLLLVLVVFSFFVALFLMKLSINAYALQKWHQENVPKSCANVPIDLLGAISGLLSTLAMATAVAGVLALAKLPSTYAIVGPTILLFTGIVAIAFCLLLFWTRLRKYFR